MRDNLYWIQSPGPGRLAVMACPQGGDGLEDHLRQLRRAGVDVVVSLLTPAEDGELGLDEEGNLCAQLGMGFESLPVLDMDVPPSEEEAAEVIDRLARHVSASRGVAIHCRMGMGRSPLLAAAVLVRMGIPAEEALDRVSRARGLDVPTLDEQKDWVRRFAEERRG